MEVGFFGFFGDLFFWWIFWGVGFLLLLLGLGGRGLNCWYISIPVAAKQIP